MVNSIQWNLSEILFSDSPVKCNPLAFVLPSAGAHIRRLCGHARPAQKGGDRFSETVQ